MNGETKEVKFNELCRVCLTKTNNMRPLLNFSSEPSDLITKLCLIMNTEIDITNTTHPSYICPNCEEKLNISHEFQKLSLKSHQLILEYTNPSILDVDKPSYVTSVTCSSEEVKEEIEPVEDIPVIFDQSDNDTESSDDENILDRVKRYNSSKKSGKSRKKVVICDQDEVVNYIKEVRMKFYTSRNCLFCGFSASNVRTLSVHMSRLHSTYKDNWCWKCNKIEENLADHTENAHKDELKCPFCGKRSTTGSHFVEHLSRHTVKRKYVCQICTKDFTSTRDLNSHYRKAHNGHSVACEICSEECTDKMSLMEHLKKHKTIKCKVCLECFSKEKYDAHICFKKENIEHENDNRVNDNKNDENKNEENLDRPKEEVIEKDSGVKPHRYCVLCERKVRNLMHHIKKHHSEESKKDEPKALCAYCGKQFKHQSNLDVHMRTHTKETPYKCSYCDVSVATRTRLVDHERTHTGEKPFVCKFCGKAFKQHGVLNTHLKIHTGRTEQCLLCPKKFCRPSELRNHMRVHTGEKPFGCTYCDKSFIQRSHLVEHTKIHTYHRPFKCHICGKAFKQSSTLKGHLNVHEGKKMFKCTVCSYSCRKSYTLKQHLLQHQTSNLEQNGGYACEESFASLDILNANRSNHHQDLGMTGNITADL